jgi:hypothetical protein
VIIYLNLQTIFPIHSVLHKRILQIWRTRTVSWQKSLIYWINSIKHSW